MGKMPYKKFLELFENGKNVIAPCSLSDPKASSLHSNPFSNLSDNELMTWRLCFFSVARSIVIR